MTLERKLASLFRLTDENWLKHANPVSVWTRYSVLPIIVLSFWSRMWIGWWCLIPGIASILWMFVNPIVFKKPISTKNWASKAVMGERIYLNRDQIAIPAIHCSHLHKLLNGLSSIGLILAIWSIIYYSIWVRLLVYQWPISARVGIWIEWFGCMKI